MIVIFFVSCDQILENVLECVNFILFEQQLWIFLLLKIDLLCNLSQAAW